MLVEVGVRVGRSEGTRGALAGSISFGGGCHHRDKLKII